MSQPKEPIPIEKLALASQMLTVINETLAKALAEYQSAGFAATDVEGWKTFQRGLEYVRRTVNKVAGPTSKARLVNTQDLLLSHHKKTSKKKQDAEALKAAERKATYQRKKTRPPE